MTGSSNAGREKGQAVPALFPLLSTLSCTSSQTNVRDLVIPSTLIYYRQLQLTDSLISRHRGFSPIEPTLQP
ncbi:MAG: hypothetical protein R6U11_00150, partial [Bacteroidales bacterium]